ncbi:Fur family transcriptional regulator [Halocella sp. SP3-1]|uniref:Fur family transcriptional regulator n=1 Tax=Halocella sp. SP3-1 TaxID=2382161 RepID=UPI000F762EFE|nr:Fur family transcriptional regulator [Halocella sp. SP3-1]AZO94671.1 transcriptional repressor [Halocella sp. SP3-1]
MSNEYEKIINCIEGKGVRLTPQRRAVINVFIENKDQHLTAADIYDLLKVKNRSLGLATIYRTLNLLENKGVVVRRNFDSETSSYEFIINQSEHNHLICKKCGKVIEIPDLLPDNFKETIFEQEKFHYIAHSTKVYGYCQDCQKELREEKNNNQGVN